MATFPVPTTGTYVNARDGHRYRFHAGDLIDLRLAVDLSLPGAVLPAEDTETRVRLTDLADVTITNPQAGDVLRYDAGWSNAPGTPAGPALVNWMPDGDFDAGYGFWEYWAAESGNGLNTDGLTGSIGRDADGGIDGGGALTVTWTADAAAKSYALRSSLYLPRNGAAGYDARASVRFADPDDEVIFRVYYYAADDLDNEISFGHNTQGGVAGEWLGTGVSDAWPDGAAYARIMLVVLNTTSAVTDRVAYVDQVAFTLLTQAQVDAFFAPDFTATPQPRIQTVDGRRFAADPLA